MNKSQEDNCKTQVNNNYNNLKYLTQTIK
jgi:hypothetical protein